jgi:hypothetical protein
LILSGGISFCLRAVVLLFHSVLRLTYLELPLVVVFISCGPVVCVLRFFFPLHAPAVIDRKVYAGSVTPCRVIPTILWGCRCSPVVVVGSEASLCTVGGRPAE